MSGGKRDTGNQTCKGKSGGRQNKEGERQREIEQVRESWEEKRYREGRMDGWRKRGRTCWDFRWCQSAGDGSECWFVYTAQHSCLPVSVGNKGVGWGRERGKEKERELEALNLFCESSCQTVPSNTIYEGLLAAFIVITAKYLCLFIPSERLWHNRTITRGQFEEWSRAYLLFLAQHMPYVCCLLNIH